MDDFKKFSPFTGKPYSKTALDIWDKMEKDKIYSLKKSCFKSSKLFSSKKSAG